MARAVGTRDRRTPALTTAGISDLVVDQTRYARITASSPPHDTAALVK